MRHSLAFALTFGALLGASSAQAAVQITIDKSTQQMLVEKDGRALYHWPLSTGRSGFDTPSGKFKAFRMEKDHFSREWDDAPMPYSIFFTQQGHAIHGTNHKITGTPESHGCVRLSVEHAGILWGLVKQQGMANVRVELDGRIPTRNELIARREPGSALTDRDYRNDPVYRGNERGFDDRIANDEPDVTGGVLPQRGAQS